MPVSDAEYAHNCLFVKQNKVDVNRCLFVYITE